MRSVLMGTAVALALAATANAATESENFARKFGRYATEPTSAGVKTLCVCHQPLTGFGGKLIYRLEQTPETRAVRVYCAVPNFGPDGKVQTMNYCAEFVPLAK